MKRYILFGFSLLMMALPAATYAQDYDDDEDDDDVQGPRALAVKQVNYETRKVRGAVYDATTQQPVAGAIVKAAEIEG